MLRSSMVLLLAVAACNGGSAAPQPAGPVHMGVVSGNNQVVHAAHATRLPAQVVAQVVQLPNGQVALRVLDALLPPKAYAQSVVNGIPGAVVCAVSPDLTHALTPEVPCTNTDALGKAYFTFAADTVAGVNRAEIRGTVNGTTHVSDSVSATVLPQPASGFMIPLFLSVHTGDTLDLNKLVVRAHDQYNNFLTTYLIRYQRIHWVSAPDSATAFAGSDPTLVVGTKVVVRAGDIGLTVAVDSAVQTGIRYQSIP